jgi:hypothetical protein
VTATGNGSHGIVAQGPVNLTIFSSNASFNINGTGILVQNGANVMVRDTVASSNASGFEAQSSAQLTLAHSVASGNNGYGIVVNSGTTVNTYQDNHVYGNLTMNVSGTLTPITAE